MICTVIHEYVLQKMCQLFNMKYISILATFTTLQFTFQFLLCLSFLFLLFNLLCLSFHYSLNPFIYSLIFLLLLIFTVVFLFVFYSFYSVIYLYLYTNSLFPCLKIISFVFPYLYCSSFNVYIFALLSLFHLFFISFIYYFFLSVSLLSCFCLHMRGRGDSQWCAEVAWGWGRSKEYLWIQNLQRNPSSFINLSFP